MRSVYQQTPLSTQLGNEIRLIRKNWTGIRLFLELLFGEIKGNYYAPHNRSCIVKMLTIVKTMCDMGLQKAAKHYSNLTRELALDQRKFSAELMTIKGSHKFDKIRMFTASSLARGIVVNPPSKEDIQMETDAAFERITSPKHQVSHELYEKLGKFIDRIFGNKKCRTNHNLPMPSGKGASDSSSKKGGSFEALFRFSTPSDEEIREKTKSLGGTQGMEPARDSDFNKMFGEMAKFFGPPPGSSGENNNANNESFALFQRLMFGVNKTYMQKAKEEDKTQDLTVIFQRALKSDPSSVRLAKLLPIVLPEGKIRVATVHTAVVNWCSRALTACLMPLLKGLAFTRSILRNKEVRIKSKLPNTKLFSADLRRSTDPISIELTKFVLYRLKDNVKDMPEWFSRAVEICFQPHDIEYTKPVTGEKVTAPATCGALMGVGPGWTVLCILNAFAAEVMAEKGSYAICGDDLIGLWTDEEIKSYKQIIHALGLEVNNEKSYISRRHGVFCERLVVRLPNNEAKAMVLHRIAESTGIKSLSGRKGRLSALDLLKISRSSTTLKVVRRTALRCYKSLCIPGLPGTFQQGGGGFGKASLATVHNFLKHGPTRLLKMDSDPIISGLRKELRSSPGAPQGVSCEEILTFARSQIETRRRVMRNEKGRKPQYLHFKDVSKQVKIKETNLSKVLCDLQYNKDDLYVRLSGSETKKIEYLLRQRRYSTVLSILNDSWRKHVDPSKARAMLLSSFPNFIKGGDLSLKPSTKWWDSSVLS